MRLKYFKRKIATFSAFTLILIIVWLIVLAVISSRYFKVQREQKIILKTNDIAFFESIPTSTNLLQNELDSFQFIVDSHDLPLSQISEPIHKINLANKVLYTSLGKVYAIYNLTNNHYLLYFNQTPISELFNPTVLYVFELPNNHVVLVFDAETIGHKLIYKILDLGLDQIRIVYEVGNYERLLSVHLGQDLNCIYLRFQDDRKYSDPDDYELYQYCGNGQPSKVSDVKPDDYYANKFAQLSAKEIYAHAKEEGCLDEKRNIFYMNRQCDYGVKYCHMFKSISPRNNDEVYQLLKRACKRRSNIVSYAGR